MIKATGALKDGTPLLVIGLSRENTRRLHDDQPIAFRADHVDPRLAPLEILLIAGDTEDSIAERLKGIGAS